MRASDAREDGHQRLARGEAKQVAGGLIDVLEQARTGSILAVAAAIGAYGLAFGVLARESGLSPGIVLALSVVVHAGGAQAAYVAALSSATPAAAVAAGALVNLRFGLYGAMLRPILVGETTAVRLIGIHFVGDEQVALATTAKPQLRRRVFWVSGVTFFVVWSMSTYLGALLGNAVGEPQTLGIDVAFPAVFVSLLVPLLRDRRARLAAAVAAAATVFALPSLSAGLPIPAATGAALVATALFDRFRTGGARR